MQYYKIGDKLTLYKTFSVYPIDYRGWGDTERIENVCSELVEVEITKINKTSYSIKKVELGNNSDLKNIKFRNSYQEGLNPLKIEGWTIAKEEEVAALVSEYRLYSKMYNLNFTHDHNLETFEEFLKKAEDNLKKAETEVNRLKKGIEYKKRENVRSLEESKKIMLELKILKEDL